MKDIFRRRDGHYRHVCVTTCRRSGLLYAPTRRVNSELEKGGASSSTCLVLCCLYRHLPTHNENVRLALTGGTDQHNLLCAMCRDCRQQLDDHIPADISKQSAFDVAYTMHITRRGRSQRDLERQHIAAFYKKSIYLTITILGASPGA